MKAIYFFLLIFLTGTLVAQNAWINEFHYDNASTDANEAVEVVIENAGLYDLNDFKVDLYNGSDSMIYKPSCCRCYDRWKC
jgi:trehalose-6-phosphatase